MSTLSDKIDKILSDKTDLIVIDGVKSAEGGAADLLKLLAIRPDVNPEEYLRIALDIGARYSGISDREEFDNIKINSDVFITGPYCLKLLSDTEDRKDSTCDLTQRAAVSGLGVGYYARIFIKLTDYPEGQFDRILLITEYVEPYEGIILQSEVTKFAKKIAHSELQYHPDFWRENIICPANKPKKVVNFKAIDWDGISYRNKIPTFRNSTFQQIADAMMKRYSEKEESGQGDTSGVCVVMGGSKRRKRSNMRATKQRRRRATKQRRRRTTKQRKRKSKRKSKRNRRQ